MTPLAVALWSVPALLSVSVLALTILPCRAATRLVYAACFAICLGVLVVSIAQLLGAGSSASTLRLPVGLPWIGAHFRMDALSAFFLAVASLGGAAASLFAIGYGMHEKAPGRVLPFYPAFLAGMNLVLLADDAFTFLFAWEFMSLSSWALVMAHHHDPENRRAGYIYIVMASFGTLCLLLTFGLLAGGSGGYAFADMRSTSAPFTGLVLILALLGDGLEGGAGAVARLAAARAPRRAQPRLRPDERGDDQGSRLRLHPHRLRPQRSAGLVVEHCRDPAGWHHLRAGRAERPDAARSEATAGLPHGREHRHHLHRPWSRAGLLGPQHAGRRRAGADRRAVPRLQPQPVQEPAVLRRRRRAQRDRSTRYGAPGRPHPSHAADRLRLPDGLPGDLGAAPAQRVRLGVADVSGDPAEP